jgi:hypothetical protein
MGGHTEAVLTACPQARAIGIDRDTEALALASERLAPFGDRFTGVHAVYDEIGEVIMPATACEPTQSSSTWASVRSNSTWLSAASPTPRTPRSTCAWTRRAD